MPVMTTRLMGSPARPAASSCTLHANARRGQSGPLSLNPSRIDCGQQKTEINTSRPHSNTVAFRARNGRPSVPAISFWRSSRGISPHRRRQNRFGASSEFAAELLFERHDELDGVRRLSAPRSSMKLAASVTLSAPRQGAPRRSSSPARQCQSFPTSVRLLIGSAGLAILQSPDGHRRGRRSGETPEFGFLRRAHPAYASRFGLPTSIG